LDGLIDISLSNVKLKLHHGISSAMVIVLSPGAMDRGFESGSGQTKDCKIYLCSFSAKHTALMSRETCLLADCSFSELALVLVMILQDSFQRFVFSVKTPASSFTKRSSGSIVYLSNWCNSHNLISLSTSQSFQIKCTELVEVLLIW
jgi:hypothetical protein